MVITATTVTQSQGTAAHCGHFYQKLGHVPSPNEQSLNLEAADILKGGAAGSSETSVIYHITWCSIPDKVSLNVMFVVRQFLTSSPLQKEKKARFKQTNKLHTGESLL
jgi:hypothetical protein